MAESDKQEANLKFRLMKVPSDLELTITSKCNLRCKYCFHFSSAGDVQVDLPTAEWLRFFEELGECTVKEVTFSGGEPFIRSDLRELIQGVVANRMRFGFLSNGTLITEDIADFISNTGRCNSIQVSIDGPGPDTHDIFRGTGSFMKALNGLKILLKYKINTAVRVTIHKHNIDYLEKAAELLIDEIGLPGFSTNSASHLGLCRQNEDMVQLTPEDFTKAMHVLDKLNRKYHGAISGLAGPVASAAMWSEMVQAKKQGLNALPGCGYLRACNGVFSRLGVRADGIIIPCTQLPHIELGRINQDSLREIWLNHPELKRLRERQIIPLSEFDFCKDCEYTNFCRGGCPALAYTLTGSDGFPSPEICLKRFLELGGKVPEMKSEYNGCRTC